MKHAWTSKNQVNSGTRSVDFFGKLRMTDPVLFEREDKRCPHLPSLDEQDRMNDFRDHALVCELRIYPSTPHHHARAWME
jgi:hypothetical protein